MTQENNKKNHELINDIATAMLALCTKLENDDTDVSGGYPFALDLIEVVHEVFAWRDKVRIAETVVVKKETKTLAELIEAYRYTDVYDNTFSTEEILEEANVILDLVSVRVTDVAFDFQDERVARLNLTYHPAGGEHVEAIKAHREINREGNSYYDRFIRDYLKLVDGSVLAQVDSASTLEIKKSNNYHHPWTVENHYDIDRVWLGEEQIKETHTVEQLTSEIHEVADLVCDLVTQVMTEHYRWITSDEYILDLLEANNHFGWEVVQ